MYNLPLTITKRYSLPETKKKTSTDEEKEKDSEEAPEIKMKITNNIILDVLENIKSMLGTSVGPETPGNVPETSKSKSNDTTETIDSKKRKSIDVLDTSLRRSKRMSSISATEKISSRRVPQLPPS